MSAELQSIKTFFSSNHITLCTDWLQSCVEWLKEENEGTNISEQELRRQVYEQWLLVDLADLQLPILPPNITKAVKFTLNTSMCLQVVSVVDISKQKLQQIMEMRKSVTSDHKSEDNPRGKRVLQLTLTDGVQEILATEYEPIRFLSLNLTPGAKVCLNAPLVIRRGQIFLRASNIKVLGGEVEKLLVSNAAENVLAGFLKLPINPNPASIEANFDDSDMEIFNGDENKTKPAIKPEILTPSNLPTQLNQPFSTVAKKETDSILTELQDPSLFEGTDFDEEISSIKPKKPNTLAFEEVYDEDEFEELMRLERDVPKPQPLPVTKPMTIEKLNSLVGKVNRGIFRIHAQFKVVAEKMSMRETEYAIKVWLQDETGEGIFAMHSDVVSDLMGYSPQAMEALKGRVAQDPVAASTLYSALDRFKETLVNLDNDMMVLVEAGRDDPMVTKLL